MSVVGFLDIGRRNPKSYLPGMFLAFLIVIGILLLIFIWFPILDAASAAYGVSEGRVWSVCLFLGGITVAWFLGFLASRLPVRALICPSCNRILRLGFGRQVPLAWQECTEPTWKCAACGYSLHGITGNARCPECGAPFPDEWLKATRKGDPDATVEFQVVE